jgi:hypothetical protein
MRLLVISLLTILAGTLLLAKFRKDMIGKVFVYISWFFIVVGFVLFIGFLGGGIVRVAHHGFHGPYNRCEMMMKGPGPGMHGRWCGPQCMDKEMRGPCCMSHDSAMKCCTKHMGDSAKMMAPKK